ncbi:hypothetical protein CISIN_1g043123mg [Citrus sinensis]|uniref:Uncharacterized protein n=1 Tax=Citrus sinensis TaxID=2711 RepID=A0A067DEW0_CITSI|nr:hypothetical protein CISIN_1g043123mg [Citrus sinensis]
MLRLHFYGHYLVISFLSCPIWISVTWPVAICCWCCFLNQWLIWTCLTSFVWTLSFVFFFVYACLRNEMEHVILIY